MIIINNGFNRGSFRGEPNGFVNLPVGSLFGRQLYKYWVKLPGKQWVPYNDLYYRPTQLEYENDIRGKVWFKTSTNKTDWKYVGLLNPVNPPPTIYFGPTMSLYYSDNNGIQDVGLLCSGIVNASNLTTDYISTISIYNDGDQDLEIQTASILNGDETYSSLIFDGTFPYTVSPGVGVGMELTTIMNSVTSSFGTSSYQSEIYLTTNIGSCSFSVNVDFEEPVVVNGFFYNQSGDEWLVSGEAGGQYVDMDGGAFESMWALWVATSDTTRELVHVYDRDIIEWNLTEHFSDPVVTDIPGNNKKFFITVLYVSSGTGNPTSEAPTNVTINSLDGIATVEEYIGMESKFLETGFDWVKVKNVSDDSLVKIVDSGQWINIEDVTNCIVTISLTNATPSLPCPPPNDNFENAFDIPFNFSDGETVTVSGSNAYATRQIGEPYPMAETGSVDYGPYGGEAAYLEYVSASVASVWWSFTTGMETGYTDITLTSSSFDTQLAIYTGSSLETLEKITFNEDIEVPVNYRSSVSFNFSPQTTYYIQVDGYYGDTGSVVVGLTKTLLYTDDNFDQLSTGSNLFILSGSMGWNSPTNIAYWGNDYGFDNFNFYELTSSQALMNSPNTWVNSSGGISTLASNPIIENFNLYELGIYLSDMEYKTAPYIT